MEVMADEGWKNMVFVFREKKKKGRGLDFGKETKVRVHPFNLTFEK